MLRLRRFFFLFVCAVVVNGILASPAFCVSGAWTAEAVGPDMSLEGRTYSVKFDPLGNIPAGYHHRDKLELVVLEPAG